MDAVMNYQPDWVIQQGKKRAHKIIIPAKARYYDAVVCWLKKVKQAYQAAARSDQWENFLVQLRQQHKPKHKLMDLLDKTFGEAS